MDVLFDVYDATGSLEVGDTEVTIGFDSVRHMHGDASLSDGIVTATLPVSQIVPPDHYTLLVFARVSIRLTSGSSRTQSKAWIEYDMGSGYVAVPGGDSYAYHRNTSAGYGSHAMCATIHIAKSNRNPIKLRASTPMRRDFFRPFIVRARKTLR